MLSNCFKNIIFLFGFMFLAMFSNFAKATSICSDKSYSNGVPSGLILRVLNETSPVFDKYNSSNELTRLHFGTKLQVTKVMNSRFYVRDIRTEKSLGWMNRDDLLCGHKALKAKNGLDGRVFIKTEEKTFSSKNVADRFQSVTVSQSSKEMKCSNNCRKLSRFSGYFIYAKKDVSDCKTAKTSAPCVKYLIADKFKLELEDILVGWISSDDVFLWNNAYGLRLSESFIGDEGNDYKYICGYRTLEKAQRENKNDCVIKLPGGWIWYETPTRMLLQETIKENKNTYYKVISPMAGERVDLSKPVEIGLGNLRHIDIAFLVDGTNSMTSAMAGVKNVMKSFTKKLPRKIQYRFAFQIYRDKYAEDKEFGDALPFPNGCNANEEGLKKNKDNFISKMEDILQASKNDAKKGDDHEENLFEGIKIVSSVLRGDCPEHMKLLFIIGDTGYSPENQKKKHGRDPVPIEDITSILDGSYDVENEANDSVSGKIDKPILAFFLQVQNKQPSNSDYNDAYKKFTTQANEIIKTLLYQTKQRMSKNEINIDLKKSDYFYSLSDKDLVEKVSGTINTFAETASIVITEFDSRVQAGESPSAVMKEMMGDPRLGNIPGRFVEQVILSKCPTSQKCNRQARVDKIMEFYIKNSPEVIEDIWMRKNDYKNLLNNIRELAVVLSNAKDATEKQKSIEAALVLSIENKLGRLLTKNEKNNSIAELYKTKLKLAVPIDSPLFSLRLNEINTLPLCVVENLSKWIVDYSQIMGTIAASKNHIPVCGTNGIDRKDDPVKYMPPRCGRSHSGMKKSNQRIIDNCVVGKKYLMNMVSLRQPYAEYKFPSNGMSLLNSFNRSADSSEDEIKDIMWVPKNFLP